MERLSSSKTRINATYTINKKGLEAFYMVSYRVARTNKLKCNSSCCRRYGGDNAGGKRQKKTIQTMPSSNNTVSRRISDMAGHVLKQLLLRIQINMRYSWLAQLLVYVRYVYGGSIKEDILFCISLETRTTGDIFKVLDSFVTSNGLRWSRCVGICTDGAKAMTGRHSGVVTRMQAVAPDPTWVHCSIHREALAAKEMPDSLKDILHTTVKMVNFVEARPLISRVFSALCSERAATT